MENIVKKRDPMVIVLLVFIGFLVFVIVSFGLQGQEVIDSYNELLGEYNDCIANNTIVVKDCYCPNNPYADYNWSGYT